MIIKLKNAAQFNAINIIQDATDRFKFTATGVIDYKEFRDTLNTQSLAEIKVFTGKSLVGVYENFTQLMPLEISEQEDGTLNITVNLHKSSEEVSRISALEDAVNKIILTELGAL